MTNHNFILNDASLVARADGALWWPDHRLLCVSDLHLGKSERIARRGGTLLPPYETRETLWRLETAIAGTDPAHVVCLGDSFDDLSAAQALSDEARTAIARLQAGRDWTWIEGNHDPGPVDVGGTHRDEICLDRLTFRHISNPASKGEVSGHYHPKAGLRGMGQKACFLYDATRLIMPAFGAFTGGLGVNASPLAELMGPNAIAVLIGRQATPIPVSAFFKR